jgi:hypothetical protein
MVKKKVSEIERPLGDGEYRVWVGYDALRNQAMLEEKLSKRPTLSKFIGDGGWRPRSSYADIDQTPGERIMLVKRFKRLPHFKRTLFSESEDWRYADSDAKIAEMDKLGYRPATPIEAYAFAKAQPELLRQFWIVVLRPLMIDGDHAGFAVLHGDSDGRIGISINVACGSCWRNGSRFLFVRK